MAKDPIKKRDTYEALREEGASNGAAAAIANAQAKGPQSSRKGGKAEPYDEWKVDDLRGRARELGVKGASAMKKADLIEALRHG